jgi:RNA polymerase sigma-70 factor (ECF subfamily)
MRLTGDYQLSCDIMQESFTRFLEHYGKEAPKLALLFTIARNAVVDDARKKARTMGCSEYFIRDPIDPEKETLIREEYRAVLTAMQQLEKDERDILALAVSSDMSYRDIAAVTATSEGNVKVKIHRARMKLRKMLKMESKRWTG